MTGVRRVLFRSKPDSTNMGGGRGNGGAFDMERFSKEKGQMPERGADSEEEADDGMSPPEMGADGMSLPEMGTDGTSLPEMGANETASPGIGADGTASAEIGADGMVPPETGADGMAPPEIGTDGMSPPETGTDDETEAAEKFTKHKAPGRGFGNGKGGMQSDDVCLNYTDDQYESYKNIFENAKTDITDADKDRLIQSLKAVKEGTGIAEVIDTDEVIRYFVAHNFVCNFDSYTGSMVHNYYLYEHNGKLNVIPWDYNLAFGGMGMGGSASEMINDAVDTPFQGTDFFNALLEDEKYLSRYHEYLRQLTEAYVCGGKFEETYNRIREQIDTLVDMDPTAFYSCEQYEAGAAMLYQTVMLRAESIQGQIDGVIPSTDEGQMADDSDLVDASEIDVNVMGSFDKGRK